jgi:D-xylose transport system permease protein
VSYELLGPRPAPKQGPAEPILARSRANIARQFVLQSRSAAGIVIAVVLVWLIFCFLTGGVFLSDRNIINLMRQT